MQGQKHEPRLTVDLATNTCDTAMLRCAQHETGQYSKPRSLGDKEHIPAKAGIPVT